MAQAPRTFRFSEHAFAWALALSFGLHAALLALQPFNSDTVIPEEALIIELLPVELPKPEPIPEPPKPEPLKPPKAKPQPKPQPVKLPQPVQNPTPQPAEALPEPAPVVNQVQPPPPQPEVIAVAPKTEAPAAAFTTPPPAPAPPKVLGPTQQELDAARAGYANALARALEKNIQYPRIATMRGWQGTVIVWLKLDKNGSIAQSSIKTSSGFDVLDQQALEAVKRTPLPLPPAVLRDQISEITVPVAFQLKNK